jgi:diguanylate cyclase (GGDEF)-like protein
LAPSQPPSSPISQLEPSLKREILLEQVSARVLVAQSMLPSGIIAALVFTWYFGRPTVAAGRLLAPAAIFLICWYLFYGLVVLYWLHISRNPLKRPLLHRVVPLFYVGMGGVGVGWGMLVFLGSRTAPADSLGMLYAIIIALISLTTFNSPAKFAVWTWVPLVISAYAAIGTIHIDYKPTLITFLTVYAVSALTSCLLMDRKAFEQTRAGIENRKQAQTISILLNEFAEANSNCLWAIGPDMKFRNVSPSLQAMFEQLSPSIGLAGLGFPHFARRFVSNAAGTVSGEALLDMVRAGETLRDVLVSVAAADYLRYWSITGRPVTDAFGAFAGYEGYLSDQTDSVLVKQELEFRANFDSVTNLYNRHQFERLLREWVAKGAERQFALLLIDLDRFKVVNDTHGHLVGDEVLEMVADRLLRCVREDDRVARIGGDEFAILLKTQDQRFTVEIGFRVIAALEQSFVVDGKPIMIGASIGAALWPQHGGSDVLLYQNADTALYQAKSRGGSIEVFGISLNAA